MGREGWKRRLFYLTIDIKTSLFSWSSIIVRDQWIRGKSIAESY